MDCSSFHRRGETGSRGKVSERRGGAAGVRVLREGEVGSRGEGSEKRGGAAEVRVLREREVGSRGEGPESRSCGESGMRVLRRVDLACLGGLEREGLKRQMMVGVIGSVLDRASTSL